MTRDTFNLPATRTWRDIPQPVVPRAMSREGRWRLVMSSVRAVAVIGVVLVCAWGVWLVAMSVRENTRAMPAVARSTPMKRPELRTDGVLDEAWLLRTLALPAKASLLDIDLLTLRARLLADDQVVNATLTRNFPDRLIVQVTERTPVARVMTEWLGQKRPLLVSRDGIVYPGNGYDAGLLETLPWLDGVTLTPAGTRFRPIQGMTVVAELLAKGRLEAEHLYYNWSVVSLAALASDQRIEVRTRDGAYVAHFTSRDDFFRQLLKLNYICEQAAVVWPGANTRIDLTLGDDVPVTPPAEDPALLAASPPPLPDPAALRANGLRHEASAAPRSEPALFLKHSQPKNTKREL